MTDPADVLARFVQRNSAALAFIDAVLSGSDCSTEHFELGRLLDIVLADAYQALVCEDGAIVGAHPRSLSRISATVGVIGVQITRHLDS